MADVRFERVAKRYGQSVPIISDLSLQVHDHEFLVLVGPSGCGKSTALRLIAGLEEITEGDIYIGDRRVNDIAPKDRDVAMVFQNYALYPHMTVRDNMAFALTLRRLPEADINARVERAARMLGIGEYLKRKPRELSGGQRQRVALGRALVREPQVFLLDEPLSNLDAKLRAQTRTEIAHLHQATRTTFIYVTHDQVEAMTMGDRIAVMNAGDIRQLGTPQELYDNPADLFVAGFIGSPAMNFFRAQLVSSNGRAEIVVGDGESARRVGLAGQGAAASRYATAEAGSIGRPVIAGVRPDHLSLTSTDAENTLAGVVDVAEHLGNEQLLYVRIPGSMLPDAAEPASETVSDGASASPQLPTVVARLDAAIQVHPGDFVTLAVDTCHIHVFDPGTSKRMTRHEMI